MSDITILTGLVNVAIPEVYQKGMSYYEVLTAVVNKVNELIQKSNEYFSSDVQTVMTNILNGWIADGTLASLIASAVLKIGDQTYTEQNYVTNGETLSDSVDALDMKVKDDSDSVASHLAATAPHFSVLSAPELSGKKIEVVAGTIRQNSVDPTKWDFINDAAHTPIGVNVGTITADPTTIRITYNKTFSKVISFICGADEYLANKFGLNIGGSVGLSYTDLKASGNFSFAERIYYDETAAEWVIQEQTGSVTSQITATSFTNGILTLTHSPILGIDVSLTPWSYNNIVAPYIPVVNATSPGTTSIKFLNTASRTFVTVPDKHCSFYLVKQNPGGIYLDGSGGHNVPLDLYNGNIWFYGLFEV